MTKKAEHEVSEAVVHCLQQATASAEKWSVAIQLDDAQARLVTKALGDVSARGGAPPWAGRQVFEVTAGSGAKAQRFTVQASVTLPLSVVVTTHSLPRGAVIGPADVQMQPGPPGESGGDCFHAVEEVLGSETTQSIGEGEVLQKRVTRAPLLVHRGEVVTVYARTGGIFVRTTARVREDGSLGDLVSVESLADRKAFLARVCGIRELEVFARAAQAESTASSVAPVAVR
jgi:flagella basal body P-ring formation protein FlgA